MHSGTTKDGMKVKCELQGRDGRKITETEIELRPFEAFGIDLNNPFPASEVCSAVFSSWGAIVTYRVAEAHGDLGSFGLREDRAA